MGPPSPLRGFRLRASGASARQVGGASRMGGMDRNGGTSGMGCADWMGEIDKMDQTRYSEVFR